MIFNETQSKRVEKVQKKITKFICLKSGKTYLSYEQRLEFLNIDSLEIRRKLQILKTIFKIKYKFCDIKNEWFNELCFYESTRNGTYCKINLNRICLVDKEFFNYCIKLYNGLPKFIRNESKLSKFMKNCKNYLLNL
jgi:hypothetical protein